MLRQFDLVELFVVGKLAVIYRGTKGARQIICDGFALPQIRAPVHPLKSLGVEFVFGRCARAVFHCEPRVRERGACVQA